jgi:hypothetical protein
VSRTWPITTARKAIAAIETQLQNEVVGSPLQKTLASAQPTNTTTLVGTSRRSETSPRRTIITVAPSTHSPATTVT